MPTNAAFAPGPGTLSQSNSSPLLKTTPPVVISVMSQIYPFICVADTTLGLLTWSLDDPWKPFLLVAVWILTVQYFEFIILYIAHIVVAILLSVVVYNYQKPSNDLESLNAVIAKLSQLSSRVRLFALPVTSLELTKKDLTRMLFAAGFMTPLYIVVARYFLSVRSICLYGGLFVLTYHSAPARATREILWRFKPVRALVFGMTSINFSKSSLRKQMARPQTALSRPSSPASSHKANSQSVRFTYVLYENQRRWLGIGWTSNMLAYERAAWTDEFLNESLAPDTFMLPDTEGTGMEWRWVDKAWKLDLTNDGLLVTRTKATYTADPDEDDGFVYYDNVWKRGSAEPSFSKYTRRRRWVRTAELVALGEPQDDVKQSPQKETKFADNNGANGAASQHVIDDIEKSTGVKSSQVEIRQRQVDE
ncbi:Peroxisomal membrane protein PEX30 [Wickerhamiella sorbophila]|uniref:Peroxisomal membrane protein PEX30 n=1 Tax=Wickerhamiella sorbophila TaxID=45607 RepID=A0A2T0FNC3_9ASCO|nr:Peroxisomal membrane protein PEX30 [Wickerhamiella sorbophila]PRT56492.1 Peroxisomal membrane protein PEX30 [Wickerhamiella sorbophila]